MAKSGLFTYLTQSPVGVGLLGAVVGGTAAAAKQLSDHKKGLITTRQAVHETGKEAAGVGVASAASVVVAGAVGGGLILSLATVLVSATVAKYAWDRSLDKVLTATTRRSAQGA